MPKGMRPFIADMGRADIKTATVRPRRDEDYFTHAIAPISPAEFERETKRAGAASDDYFVVNGTHYVIGRKAVRRGFKLQLGQNRYTPDYYGVLGAIAMTRLLQESADNVFWVGTHAPEDVDYIGDLLSAVVCDWRVQWRGQKFVFKVLDGVTVDEPLAGYYNAILRHDGLHYADTRIVNGTTLMLDTGGYTTDAGVIDPQGEIDYSSFQSQHIGVLEAVEQFGRDFRSDNSRLLKGVELDRQQVHKALRTGVLDLRGLNEPGTRGYDVSREASYVRDSLANEVTNFYERYGGAAYYDTLVLTGGGGALLEAELTAKLRHNALVLADKRADELHMANARGARKWYLMHELLETFA